jgi:dihydropteroate synthase
LSDYYREIRKLNNQVTLESIRELLNPELTLKFFQLSDNTFHFLKNILEKNKFPCWFNPAEEDQIIVSFPNWKAVQDITTHPEFRKFKDISNIYEIQLNLGRNAWEYSLKEEKWQIDRPLIMGILNITPDSFSDGGKFFKHKYAVDHALKMVQEGADIIDIGAESTRPGSEPVSVEEEWKRIYPVLKEVRGQTGQLISIDTYKSEIARKALDEGADIVNDVSGLRFDPEMAKTVTRYKAPLILMHMQGTPRNMQLQPHYHNLMEEIFVFFANQVELAKNHGIEQIILDPGIGFGKRYQDNFELIRRLAEFRIFGYPLLLGTSRKSFIGRALDKEVTDRLYGTAATVAIGVLNGANILRVHDVKEIRDIISISQLIKQSFHSDR